MNPDTAQTVARPGAIARFRSRQSGHPSGPIGRIFGRIMVKDTADANDRAISLLDLTAPRTVLEIGFRPRTNRCRPARRRSPRHRRRPIGDHGETSHRPQPRRMPRRSGRPPPQRRRHDPVRRQHRRRRVHRPTPSTSCPTRPRRSPRSARVLPPGRHPRHRLPHQRHPTHQRGWTPTSTASPPPPSSPACSPTAGFDHIDHHTVEATDHQLHLFAAHLARPARPST